MFALITLLLTLNEYTCAQSWREIRNKNPVLGPILVFLALLTLGRYLLVEI